jgi:hypothetical protein
VTGPSRRTSRTRRARRTGWTALTAATALTASAHAQVRASEAASISQTVDGTKLTVSYSRPRARNRDSLFGKVIKWNEVWTPGANMATTLELSKDARLDGHAIPKGKYSVWMVVRRESAWTLVLDPRTDLFHEAHPDSTDKQIRFPLRSEQRPFAEVLTWSFPEVRVDGMTLAMQWGTVYVPLQVSVDPSYKLGFPESESATYLGRYDYRWKTPGDSAGKPIAFTVTYEAGNLIGRWDPPPFGEEFPEWNHFAMIPIKGGDHWFIPAWLDSQGKVLEVSKEMVLEFMIVGGRASGFDVRSEDDKVMATAKRKS